MPRWVRWLQPLLSGVFTVDNLDYVRRDAWMTGVAIDVDVERLRRYTFIGPRGLTLYEPGLGDARAVPDARGCSCTSRSTSTGRSGRSTSTSREVFGPSIVAIFGDGVAGRAARGVRRPRRVRARSTRPRGGRAGSRWPTRRPGDGTVTPAVADGWRAILLRRPRWRAEAEVRARVRGRRDGRTDAIASLGAAGAGPRRDRPRGRRRSAGRRDGDGLAARGRGPGRVVAVAGPVAGPIAGLRDDRPPLPAGRGSDGSRADPRPGSS